MSEEHYPARSTGNDNVVGVNFPNYFDKLVDFLKKYNVYELLKNKSKFDIETEKYFDEEMSEEKYPNGRTARTLCKRCNTFIGKYDEAYKLFYDADGEAKKIKGYTIQTKYNIIKAVFAKFLSIPETQNEEFDFIDFIKDEKAQVYNGKWNLYMVERDHSTKVLGLAEINTRSLKDERGTIYEYSDEKFMYFLMNYEKEKGIEMTNIFEILNKNYTITLGVGENGGYYAEMLYKDTFDNFD